MKDITFLTARPPSYVIFVASFVYSDFTKKIKMLQKMPPWSPVSTALN